MTDLQEQLKNIYFRVQKGLITEEGFVAQVEAAYEDAKYVKVPKQVEDTWQEYNRMAGFMTGQEWYGRFEHEAKHTGYYGEELPLVIAAKRAAGLEVGDE